VPTKISILGLITAAYLRRSAEKLLLIGNENLKKGNVTAV